MALVKRNDGSNRPPSRGAWWTPEAEVSWQRRAALQGSEMRCEHLTKINGSLRLLGSVTSSTHWCPASVSVSSLCCLDPRRSSHMLTSLPAGCLAVRAAQPGTCPWVGPCELHCCRRICIYCGFYEPRFSSFRLRIAMGAACFAFL